MKLPSGNFVGYIAAGRIDGFCRFSYSNCFCYLAEFKAEIEAYLLGDLNGQASGSGAKTLFDDREFVICRSHVRENIYAIPVGYYVLLNVGRNICKYDFGIWYCRTLGILHRSANRAILRLREE